MLTSEQKQALNQFRPIPLLRNSERADYKMCPAKWNWRWQMGLVPAMPKQDARWFGTLWHLVWATVYTPPEGKNGFTRSITTVEEIHQLWDELCKDAYTTISCGKWFDDDDEKEFLDAQALGHIMIQGQFDQWNLDPQFEVLMPEQRFRAKVPFNRRQRRLPLSHWVNLGFPRGSMTGGNVAEVVGTFDLPVRDHSDNRGRVWILDWKSTNRRDNLKQANKDDQLGLYIGVATMVLRQMGLIGAEEACAGGVWSFARKAKPPTNVDDQGRVRNQPQIKHYKEALLNLAAVRGDKDYHAFVEEDFKGLKKEDLAKIAIEAGLTVWGDISKNQGAPLFWREVVQRNKANRIRQMARLADDAEVLSSAKHGVIPITKSPGEHCNWCDFSDLCDIDEDGGDTEDFIKNVFKIEDPYSDHYEGAENSKQSLLTRKR